MVPRDGSDLLVVVILLMLALAVICGIGWFALTRGAVTVDCSWVGGECGMTLNR